jgi:hypothetical protein
MLSFEVSRHDSKLEILLSAVLDFTSLYKELEYLEWNRDLAIGNP